MWGATHQIWHIGLLILIYHVGIPYPPADIIAKCGVDSGKDRRATMVSTGDTLFINTGFITQLIEIYRTYTCLWHIGTKDDSNRVKKHAAYKSLVHFCQAVDPDCGPCEENK